MTAGIQLIALSAPLVASNAVFSMRRASRGIDAMTDNPFYGAMNMDIAAGQTLKGARAAKAIAVATESGAEEVFSGAANAIKDASNGHKFLAKAGKVIDFTADHINPIICATSAVKVLGSDDKTEAATRETIALTSMFTAENAAKKLIGMPKTVREGYNLQEKSFMGIKYNKKVGGRKVTKKVDGLYKNNVFLDNQVSAFKDYCATKKLFNKISLKALPGLTKGLLFVGASIAGYKAGDILANTILGEAS